jgi:O-antigen ligase
VVLTASRTGLVSVLILALWGLLDRRLSRPTRALLLAAPLVYALGWFGMALGRAVSHHAFGGATRLAETDVSGSRFGIWANTLALIRAHPGPAWATANSTSPGR